MSRRAAIGLAIYGLALAAIVGGRGFTLARALGGRYPPSAFLFDVTAFALIIVALRLFDRGVRTGVEHVVGKAGGVRRGIGLCVYAVVVLGVAFPLLLATLQFHPIRIAPAGTPGAVGLPYADITFVADGLRLSGWHIPAGSEDRPIVLVTHGFNANKENFLVPAVLLHQMGYDAVLFDFRAHGDSAGRTSTFGLREGRDVEAARQWIRRTHPGRPIYALGYSMGGAAVIEAAARHGLFDRVVLDSTFGSLERVARATLLRPFGPAAGPLWHLGRLWGWLWTGADVGGHQPERHIGILAERPLLLIHGTGDRLIPHQETLRLYEATGRRAGLWLVGGADHIQTVDHPEYRERLRRFFE